MARAFLLVLMIVPTAFFIGADSLNADEPSVDPGVLFFLLQGSAQSFDEDEDGADDDADNCPIVSNPDQADQDSDGKGDACDACPIYASSSLDGCPDSLGQGICPVEAPEHVFCWDTRDANEDEYFWGIPMPSGKILSIPYQGSDGWPFSPAPITESGLGGYSFFSNTLFGADTPILDDGGDYQWNVWISEFPGGEPLGGDDRCWRYAVYLDGGIELPFTASSDPWAEWPGECFISVGDWYLNISVQYTGPYKGWDMPYPLDLSGDTLWTYQGEIDVYNIFLGRYYGIRP